MQDASLTLPKSNTTEQLTEGARCHSNIPEGEARIDVPVTVILDKHHYRRFMALIQNDNDIFAQVVSDVVNSHLDGWAGKRLSSGCPEVLLEYIEAALNKHIPLPADNEESEEQEA
jgi:hypothetical protein